MYFQVAPQAKHGAWKLRWWGGSKCSVNTVVAFLVDQAQLPFGQSGQMENTTNKAANITIV
jgi:hypothetical protein